MKMTLKSSLLAWVLAALALPSVSFARTEKQARSNDVASSYILENNGDLFRMVRGNKCQITSRVDSFKVSQHKDDAAMIYFEKDGTLHVLNNASSRGNCPKATTVAIMGGVVKYSVVSNTNTTIVNVALNREGKLVAWDNEKIVFTKNGIDDYKMNLKYGAEGAPYSSYVLFAIDRGGWILKVRGQNPITSKFDVSRRYGSVRDFMISADLE